MGLPVLAATFLTSSNPIPASLRLLPHLCAGYGAKSRRAHNPSRVRRPTQRFAYSTVIKIPQYRPGTMAPQSQQTGKKIDRTIPMPSSSVLLISAQNEVLLLHRVKTSSSFPSAHVFPGGNISAQDGDFPPAGHPDSHDEGIHYRRAAIRELFEESGILLAKSMATGRMVHVSAEERERGRHAIHTNELTFDQWLKSQDPEAEPDTEPLLPFTHWITPIKNIRRYTTQMYLYFLPLEQEPNSDIAQDIPTEEGSETQMPTPDGGLEVTEAQFLPATEWLRLATRGEIIMFPPQFLLLSFVAQFLDKAASNVGGPQSVSQDESAHRRSKLCQFAHSGVPPWTHKFISPRPIAVHSDGRSILGLDSSGPELQGTDKKGETDRVVLTRFAKEGPREVEIRWRHEILPSNETSKSSL